MPIQLPNLDNRKFTDLMEEALALIPTYAPEWTNHNPSDPGITLLELFAYLTEMLIYRLNRVTTANVRSFLTLLNGPHWEPSGLTPDALAEDVRLTVLALRKRERAVTCEDFVKLALEADEGVARAHCVPRRNLSMDLEAERAGNVTLIVVPEAGHEPEIGDIVNTVEKALDARRLLTTLLHVVPPFYLTVGVQATIVPNPDERLPEETGAEIQQRVLQAVEAFLNPLDGGGDGQGWPFGRNVFVSELYDLLDRLAGVDFVVSVDVTAVDAGRSIRNDAGELVGISVKPYELVNLQMTTADVTVQTA
jgi:hypothetical protein